jgi:SAM-dependent methyltransferase
VKRALREFARVQAFVPTWAGILVNPSFIARRGLARAMAELAPALGGRVLDVGCGTKPNANFFSVDEYIGLDVASDASRSLGMADVLYDGSALPFEAGSFDGIVCNQVLEHVFEPDRFLSELHRVLRPHAPMLLTVPFVWDEHEQPLDYARYSSFGLKALLERHGFVLQEQRKIGADVSVLFQLANAYLYKILPARSAVRYAACALLMAPISAAGIVLGKLLPGNADLYLDQVVLARKAETEVAEGSR